MTERVDRRRGRGRPDRGHRRQPCWPSRVWTCLVLDRYADVLPRPRAVHLDDEVYRILARMGVGAEFAAISRPAKGLRLLDADSRVLAEFARSDGRRDPRALRRPACSTSPSWNGCCGPASPAARRPACAATSR